MRAQQLEKTSEMGRSIIHVHVRSPVTAQKEAFATTYLILLFLKVYVVSRDVESRSTNSIHHHHLHVSSGTVRKISQSSSCCNGSAVSMKWSVRRSHPRHRHQPHFQAAADAHSCCLKVRVETSQATGTSSNLRERRGPNANKE